MELNIIPINNPIKNHKKKGIYFLFDKNKQLKYIGIAKNIKGRINEHLKDNSYSFVNPSEIIYYFYIETYEPLLEQLLISIYKPSWNIEHNFDIKRDKNITKKCIYCNQRHPLYVTCLYGIIEKREKMNIAIENFREKMSGVLK